MMHSFMNKPILYIFLLIFASLFLNAQEKSCTEYVHTGFSTGPNPIISPIFPGCEAFKENNDSLDYCFRNQIGTRIAEKFDKEFSPIAKLDGTSLNGFQTKIIIDIKQSGKLEMKLKERIHSEFENQFVLKLNEISNETTGIIPAKLKNNYCSSYRYQLPIIFDLTEWNEN